MNSHSAPTNLAAYVQFQPTPFNPTVEAILAKSEMVDAFMKYYAEHQFLPHNELILLCDHAAGLLEWLKRTAELLLSEERKTSDWEYQVEALPALAEESRKKDGSGPQSLSTIFLSIMSERYKRLAAFVSKYPCEDGIKDKVITAWIESFETAFRLANRFKDIVKDMMQSSA